MQKGRREPREHEGRCVNRQAGCWEAAACGPGRDSGAGRGMGRKKLAPETSFLEEVIS